MYYFIFYFIYKAKLKADGASQSRYSASLIVSIFLGIHLGLLYAVTRFVLCYYWQISIARSNVRAAKTNTLFYFLLAMLLCLICYFYFNKKRISIIETRYAQVEKFYTFPKITKFILLFILPLLLAIYLVNKSVVFCM